jgi:hypothetical protein
MANLLIHVSDFGFGPSPDIGTGRAGSDPQPQKLFDFLQREPQVLSVPDEVQLSYGIIGKDPIAGMRPGWFR